MAETKEFLTVPAEDGFERYYAEKLWEWIPPAYRHEDGLETNPNPHVLRAIVEVLAIKAAVARRSIDRLWEDQFIDTCDDWAVPYLADLVGTRLLSSLNRRGRRIDVARTIFYRRRKGTPVVMETLIQDITGWEGAVVESFRRLGRTRHRLDLEPGPLAGLVTGTPPGGTADLRAGRGGDVIDGPFEDFSRTPDFRRHRGWKGRYNIPKLNFHLYRLGVFEVEFATPLSLENGQFTFDPSGRDIALFSPDQRRNQSNWTPVEEWQLPAPIPCRLFNKLPEKFTPTAVSILLGADPESGPPLEPSQILGGNLEDWDLATDDGAVEVIIDLVRGRFLLTGAHPVSNVHVPGYHYGFAGKIGAGTFSRPIPENPDATAHTGPNDSFTFPSTGIHEFADSSTFRVTEPTDGVVEVDDLRLLTRDGQRPYVIPMPEASDTWILRANESDEPQDLLIDGLWLGFPSSTDPAPVRRTLALEGRFGRVTFRHCTLDPGGVRADGETIPFIEVEIRGEVREMIIQSSITGPIRESTNEVNPCSVAKIMICDSIVHSLDGARPAILTRVGEVRLERVTVFGNIEVNRLHASEALVQGEVTVTDNQHSCIRFSAASGFNTRRFESHVFPAGVPNHFFTSRRFGDAGYAQLSQSAPEQILRGAENRSEIGAFSSLLNPIRRDDLEVKVLEYMPFGLIPQFIFET